MKKILNKRLESISAFITDNEKIIDIGCDHALLDIYLVLNRNNLKVIASDINEKPLIKAKENLEKYNVSDKIELKCGNGLDPMDKDIETIIISGMGGITITTILQSIKSYPNVKKIILSPNCDFPLVRKSLQNHKFTINKEIMVYEKEKYYLISEYIPGNKKVNNYFGKLDVSNDTVKSYYKSIYNKNKKILSKLPFFKIIKRFSLIKENILIKKKIDLS